ncbi:hypothetical protein N8979_00260 [bacterium]|nr:hypothetical protein [bacterium]
MRAAITAAYRRAIAAGELSSWALPDRIDIVSEIAKTSVGKIDKKQLRVTVTGDGGLTPVG